MTSLTASNSSPKPPRSRRRVVLTLVGVVCVVSVALTVAIRFVRAEPGDTATTEVGSNGFSLEVKGVAASAPPGVAPEGTSVTLRLKDLVLPDPWTVFAEPTSLGVELVLGDGVQPAETVTLEFDSPRPEAGTVVLSKSAFEVAPVESRFDSTRGVIVSTTDHLSEFAPVALDGSKFWDFMVSGIEFVTLGPQVDMPDCFLDTVETQFGTLTVDEFPDPVVWPCFESTSEGTVLTLTSNTNMAWKVISDVEAAGVIDPAPGIGSIFSTAAAMLVSVPGTFPMLSGDEIKLTYKTENPRRVTFILDGGLSLISAIAFGLSLILPDEILLALDSLDCLKSAIDGASAVMAGSPTQSDLASAAHDTITCLASELPEGWSDMFGIVTAGPRLLATYAASMGRLVSGTSVVQLNVSTERPRFTNPGSPDRDPSTTWLYEVPSTSGEPQSGEQVTADFVFDGASFSDPNATAQWVSCTSTPAKTTYLLNAQYAGMSFDFVPRDHVPDGFVGRFRVLLDGVVHYDEEVAAGTPSPQFQLLTVEGVHAVTVEAELVAGDCGPGVAYSALTRAQLYRLGAVPSVPPLLAEDRDRSSQGD